VGTASDRASEAVDPHHDYAVCLAGFESCERGLEAGTIDVAAREILVVVPGDHAAAQFARVALNSVPLYGGGDVPFAFSAADSADADVSI
jgi:hypothetical protein